MGIALFLQNAARRQARFLASGCQLLALVPSKTATVWLAIDDADCENACMRFIPGTHHFGHLTYRLTENDGENVLDQTVEDAEEFGEPIDVELKAREISIHNDLLLHGSQATIPTAVAAG